jgi:hypothetical protein
LSDSDQDDLVKEARELAKKAGRALQKTPKAGEKNLLVSGGLSLFGPLGWLYAGSYKEAIPAAILYYIAWKLIPTLFMAFTIPVSIVIGFLYAWQYNREGKRMNLFLDDGDEPKSP